MLWSTALRRSGRSSVTSATRSSTSTCTVIIRPDRLGTRIRLVAWRDPMPTPSTADDPIRARREQIARWTLLANRIGYLFVALAIALFFIAFVFGFTATMATLVITSLVVGCVLLAPSIVLGYAVKAAERDDVERGF